MALFKSLRGKRENLPSTKTDGYAYFCTNDGTFWIDYKDENGVVQRKQLNAKDAETILGASLSTILNSSDVEIPTSKAVLDALDGKVDKVDAGSTTQPVYFKDGVPTVINTLDSVAFDGYVTKGKKSGTTVGSKATAEGKDNTASGNYSHAEGNSTVSSGQYSHSEGYNTTASGTSSHSEGCSSKVVPDTITPSTSDADIITEWNSGSFAFANGPYSHVEGLDNLALGSSSHAEGRTTISSGTSSHSEGFGTVASEYGSHAEGWQTTSSHYASHSEGRETTASGNNSHAEGYGTLSSGENSHAEGVSTVASGRGSHAEGEGTSAMSALQHVEGKYNIKDYVKYAHIVGNGTSDSARSNAHTLDWSGNAWYAGKVSVGTTSNVPTPTNANDLVTKKYVDGKVAGLVDSAPETLDTLNELSAALGDDPNFATTVANQIGTKVDKVDGKGLSTNDYTTAEKNKLSGIASGAQVNSITGVKGSSETTYRTGNVSISKTNIGLGNVDNTSDKAKPISDATQSALDNKAALSHKHSAQDINQGTLSFENGGTGATDRINAIHNLMLLTGNSVPNADTPTEWAKFGDFKCYYNENTTVINKPTTYGTLIQIIPTDAAASPISLQQIWLTQLTSQIFIRSGNATGWNGDASLTGADAWKQIFGAYSTIPVENGGTAATTAVNARKNLGITPANIGALPTSGGTLTGNLTGKYITGTWLQTSEASNLGKAAPNVAVLDDSGWIYKRTPAELLGDTGVSDYIVNKGTSGGWHYEKWNSGKLELWRQTTSSNLGTTGQINGWYYRAYTMALPPNLLKNIQDVQCNCVWGTGVSFASGSADTANFKAIYFSNQNGGAGTFWHRITGTWK